MTTPLSIYYNPTAGAGGAQRVLKEVEALLNTHHIQYTIGLWPYNQSSTPKAKGSSIIYSSMPKADILLIGGDGTFNTLLNQLPHPEQHRFILLPAGTSNSLCSQISPKEDAIRKLNRYLTNPQFIKVDLPQVTCNNTTYRFINEASVGFAAAIARTIEKSKTKKVFNALHLNELGYIFTAFRCWRKDEPYMLSLCNNKRISGNLFPCPQARIDDGRIDVYELQCSRIRLPFELTRLVGATSDTHSTAIRRSQMKEGVWQFDKPLPVEVDGNPVGETTQLTLSLYPHQLQII